MSAFSRPFAQELTRDQLYACLDMFMLALRHRDPSRVTWAEAVRCTENNVALSPGDGLWNTITGQGDYDLRFADPLNGQVGLFSTIVESDEESAFSLRLKVEEGAIAEVEMIVVRRLDLGSPLENQRFWRKPILEDDVPAAARATRERMIALSYGYFSTLECNDGNILTKFHAECDRVQNGIQTTRNTDLPGPLAHMGCEDQFRSGNFRFNDRVRGRRFPLVDEERGLVLAAGFIDHSGRLATYQLTDGTTVESPYKRPHSLYFLELFKISEAAIRQIETNFIPVPYRMASPWDG